MAEPYGGAVRRCPQCPPSLSAKWSNCNSYCDAGWVPVDTLTATIRCEVCKGAGWTEALDPAGVRMTPRCGCERGQSPVAGSWAYPQPGDIVLTEKGDVRRIDRDFEIGWVLADDTIPGWPVAPADLRLVVDQPNTGRIPGTQPPGADHD